MSTAFERFAAGEDRLSNLLKSLPGYRPTAEQEASFAAAAHAAQLVDAEEQLHFEAPVRLQTAFRARAAQLEIEAETQRKTILKQIKAGTHPDAILRSRMHPATTRWLRAQAALIRHQRIKRLRKLRRSLFSGCSWSILGRVVLAGILAAIVTRWLLSQAPSPTEIAFLEAFRNESTLLPPPLPDVPQNQVGARSAHSMPHRSRLPASAAPPGETDPEPDMSAHDAGSAPSSEMTSASLASSASIPATSMAATPRSDSLQATRKTLTLETTPVASGIGAAPRSPHHRAASVTMTSGYPPDESAILFSLEESPALVAKRLPERLAGMIWLVRTPTSTPDGLQDWLDALIRAIPAAHRPAGFNVLSDLPPGNRLQLFPPSP